MIIFSDNIINVFLFQQNILNVHLITKHNKLKVVNIVQKLFRTIKFSHLKIFFLNNEKLFGKKENKKYEKIKVKLNV